MASPIDPSLPPSNHIEIADETSVGNLDVCRGFPRAVSGRLLGVQDDVVHSLDLDAGRVRSYRSRTVRSKSGTDLAASDIFVFSGSILAFGPGSLAHELSADLETVRPVDLAGRSRPLSACPKRDPFTGDLHLLALDPDGRQAHVVVPSGALTRRAGPVLDALYDVADLVITRDHVLFVADGFVGVTSHDGEAQITWVPTGVDAPVPVYADDVAGGIVMHAVTPLLERWVLHPASATMHREELDPTPRRFAHSSHHVGDAARQLLWATGHRAADTYDLATGRRVHHSFGPSQPGDLAFVADPSRPGEADGGWLVGFVHDSAGERADLVVLDAADISGAAVASVRVPRRIPSELRTTWIPETISNDEQGDRP